LYLKEPSITEEQLLAGLSGGDPRALKRLIGDYFPILCRFAEKFLADPSLAKDVVQETFIKLWATRSSFGSFPALKGFLYVATKNACLNLNRGRERQEVRHRTVAGQEPDSADPVWTEMVRAENIALIYRVVRTLPPAAQEVFYLSYEEGLTVGEIAVRLKMKLKTVKNHKYKTLVLLRNKFGTQRGPLLALLAILLK
jgi:RNA polymerase sigma factor (sigma-70 family)